MGPTIDPLATHDAGRQGAAMLEALLGDFAVVGGLEVTTLVRPALARRVPAAVDCRILADPDQEPTEFSRLAAAADWTLVIAPEWCGTLLERARWVAAAGGRLLGSSLETLELTGDKQRLAEHLAECGLPVPRGRTLAVGERPPADFAWPAVRKPRDGAGSRGVRLVSSAHHLSARAPAVEPERLECYCRGMPASASLLCGGARPVSLVPCRQHLSSDGTFEYRGSSLPLPPGLAARAEALARRAVDQLPAPLGYLGVDLVLGDDDTGADDYVIEINARVTSSYLLLSQACRGNLAAALLDVASGKQPAIEFDLTPRELELNPPPSSEMAHSAVH